MLSYVEGGKRLSVCIELRVVEGHELLCCVDMSAMLEMEKTGIRFCPVRPSKDSDRAGILTRDFLEVCKIMLACPQ
jgi:hypothetical protein